MPDEKVEKRDTLRLVRWVAILIWVGLVLAIEYNYIHTKNLFDTYFLLYIGPILILLAEIIVRLLKPNFQKYISSSLITMVAFIGLFLGWSGWFGLVNVPTIFAYVMFLIILIDLCICILQNVFLRTKDGSNIKTNKLYKIVGVIAYTAVAFLMVAAEMEQAFLIMWLIGGLAGISLLIYKRRLSLPFFSNLSCLLWILFGWWALIIIISVLWVMGPIILLIAVILKPNRKCPNCKKVIAGDAIKCPYCASEIEPII